MAARKATTKYAKIDEHGRRIGESKPRPLSDHEVALLREFVADAQREKLTPAQFRRRVAEKFGVSARR